MHIIDQSRANPPRMEITLTGRLAADVDLREVSTARGENAVCDFRVAHDVLIAGGERETHWVPCSAWGTFARQIAAAHVGKGSYVTVRGRFAGFNFYKDKSGNEITQIKITVEEMEIHDLRPSSNGGTQTTGARPGGARPGGARPTTGQTTKPPEEEPPPEFDDDIPF